MKTKLAAHPTRAGMFLVAAFLLIAGAGPAHADGSGYEQCKDVLVNNTVTSNRARKAASYQRLGKEFFSKNVNTAWTEFKQMQSRWSSSDTHVDAAGGYGFDFISGKLGVDVKQAASMTFDQFSSAFSSAYAENSGSEQSDEGANEASSDHYVSTKVAPGAVEAWRACVTKTTEANIYALASRDDADNVYVSVVWVPGYLQSPTIAVGFVKDGDIAVRAKQPVDLHMGTGASFPVDCGKKCDAGFRITVNGTLGGRRNGPEYSFTTSAIVPPKKRGPQECSWAGAWKTEWNAGGPDNYGGTLMFTKMGEQLSAVLDFGVGTTEVQFEGSGRLVTGRWTHTKGKSGGPCENGTLAFTKQGCSFQGTWNYCAYAPRFWWKGEKITPDNLTSSR